MADIEVRICENCGHINDVASLECVECGYDLSFVVPTMYKAEENGLQWIGWVLTAVDDNTKELIVKDTVIIGREADVLQDYFNKSSYISRHHAKLYVDGEQLYIEDASTNGTCVNGVKLPKLQKTALKKGDEVTFADLKFLVRG